MSFFQSLFGGGGGGGSRVSGGEARELVKAGAQLIDVRTPGEFGMGHVDGAKNIPVDQLAARAGELDPAKPVVLYCRSGARSASAAATLKAKGFQHVCDLGPMSAW